MINKIVAFFKNVYSELKYVSWPSSADIKEGTTVVIVMSTIVAIFLSLVDWGFAMIINALLLKG
jgi:preprotein translocase subunit SecE